MPCAAVRRCENFRALLALDHRRHQLCTEQLCTSHQWPCIYIALKKHALETLKNNTNLIPGCKKSRANLFVVCWRQSQRSHLLISKGDSKHVLLSHTMPSRSLHLRQRHELMCTSQTEHSGLLRWRWHARPHTVSFQRKAHLMQFKYRVIPRSELLQKIAASC
jgi:hypothetical protein